MCARVIPRRDVADVFGLPEGPLSCAFFFLRIGRVFVFSPHDYYIPYTYMIYIHMCVCARARALVCDHKYGGNTGDWGGGGWTGGLFAEGEDENTIIYEEGNEHADGSIKGWPRGNSYSVCTANG